MININSKISDPFYRYKMHEVLCEPEKQHTLIVNLEEIGRDLKRDPANILRFLGLTLGCSTKIAEHNKMPKYLLPGTYDESKLQSTIFEFIDLFVLCNACGNPETFFLVSDGVLMRQCNSCGAVFKQQDHKLNVVFLKDIGNQRFNDKNYEKEMTRDVLKNENCTDIVNLSYKDLKIEDIKNVQDFLLRLENVLESEERPEQIKKFLKEMVKLGVDIEEIEEYFEKPKKDGKRNPLIKNRVKKFLDECE
ncbi:C37C3.2 [Ecytonucleospora hepatopenaei]|uniref:C37C3.2 n=1 Tax=Ecytonucleospora hepatopenaei TaxID=646526 RepID=A0A1W0E5A7_9MICR|nr:C37C3.2 [Ecytonucleospora hepatopenaei]